MILRRSLDWWLAVLGATIPLFYIPNGVMHLYLGRLVYARELLLLMHLGATLHCLHRAGHLPILRRSILPLFIFGAFLLPLTTDSTTQRDFLVICKWVLLWTDAILTGYLVFLQRRFVKTVAAIGTVALSLFALDGVIGLYELRTNSFVFAVQKEEETEAGVQVARSQQLAGVVRVQGMQRDVFSFANFMGVAFVTCLTVLARQRRWWLRAGAAIGVLGFCYVGFYSGGRSALLGMALALALFGIQMLSPPFLVRHGRKIMASAVVFGGVICFIGLAELLQSVIALVSDDSRVFNLASTYDRDAVWTERLDLMRTLPLSFALGMPTAKWMVGDALPVQFTDNQVLWIVFHTGVGGLALMLTYFYRLARPQTCEQHPTAYPALMFYMALLFGEGIARDTLFMFSAVPVFLLNGYFSAADAYAQADSETLEGEEEEYAELTVR